MFQLELIFGEEGGGEEKEEGGPVRGAVGDREVFKSR
jgi:hypothetical protein